MMWLPLLAVVLRITFTLARSGSLPSDSDSLDDINPPYTDIDPPYSDINPAYADLHEDFDTDNDSDLNISFDELPLLHGALALRLEAPKTLRDAHNITIVATVINTSNKTLKIVNDPEVLLNPRAKHNFEFHEQSTIEPSMFASACSGYSPYQDQLEDELSSRHNYTILKPGEHKSVAHDVSGMYTFRHAGPHVVWVAVKAEWFRIVENNAVVAFAKARMINDPIAGKAAIINIDESVIYPSPNDIDVPISVELLPRAEKDGSVSYTPNLPKFKFTECSPKQQGIITIATASANAFINEVNTFLSDSNSLHSARYKTWFGGPDENLWDTVKKCFSSLQNRLDQFEYSCECSECMVDAFANPNRYGTLNLCTKFWRAPHAGSNSRAGALVRELTRFDETCGTDYIAGGRSLALSLAAEYSEEAVMNSDNYQYFAENATLPASECYHCM